MTYEDILQIFSHIKIYFSPLMSEPVTFYQRIFTLKLETFSFFLFFF